MRDDSRIDWSGWVWTWAIVVLLSWGVFALAASGPWGYLPLLAGMAAFSAAAYLKRGQRRRVGRGLYLSIAIFCGAILVQLLPLPLEWLGAISPSTMRITATAADNAASLDRWATSRPLSIDPMATALGLGFVVALAGFFAANVRTLGRIGCTQLAAGIVALGTAVACAGLAEASSSWHGYYRAMGVSLPPDTMPHGPFSSKNHFAGWMLMSLSVTMGYLGSMLERAKGEGTAHTVTVQAAVLIMAVSLIQTQSRAGIVELALAIVVMGVLMVRRGVDTRRPLVSVSVIAVLLVTAVGIGGIDPIVERFRAPSWATAHGRTPIWHQAASISRDFPLTGSGFNTFQTAVTHYPIAEHPEPYEAAHNDYLQLSAEGGLLLGVPAIAVIGFFVREVRNRFRESSSRDETAWLRIGAVLGLLLVAIQAAVDYSLQIPANAALFVVLAAMAVHRAPTEPHEQAQRRSWSQPEMTSHA